MSFPDYRTYSENTATKEFVENHMDLFYPEIEIQTEKTSYEELKNIDASINEIYPNERHYVLTDLDEKDLYSSKLNNYSNYYEI